MTDRELLELAAKAVGYTIHYEESVDNYGYVEEIGGYWNPLEDDGDALRLASGLNMNIKQDDPNAAIAGWSNLQRINITHSKDGPWHWKEWLRDHESDRDAATRRAIVRAAAEIGKAMKGEPHGL